MQDILYKFDELPLVTAQGLILATCTGEATITYDRNGFGVTDIWVNGWRRKTEAEQDADREAFKSGKRGYSPYFERLIPLDSASTHYATIKAALERDELGLVAEQVAIDRDDRRDAA